MITAVDLKGHASGPPSPREGNGKQGALYLRIPSSTKALEWVRSNLQGLEGFQGFLVDEDDEESDLQLELSVSKLDRDLIEKDVRWRFDILAEGNMVRGSEDIVKLVAMGADCVGFGKAALVAVGFEDDQEVVDRDAEAGGPPREPRRRVRQGHQAARGRRGDEQRRLLARGEQGDPPHRRARPGESGRSWASSRPEPRETSI